MKHNILNLTAAVVGAAVSMYGIVTYTVTASNKMDATQPAGHVASSKVKAAMRYHGLCFEVFSDRDNVLWFMRDGVECRLYTSAFMDATYGRDYI